MPLSYRQVRRRPGGRIGGAKETAGAKTLCYDDVFPVEATARASVAALIDHTLLRPEATAADIRKLCAEARQYGFASVCVNPYWAPLATAELAGSQVKTCTVIGFPLGANATSIKVVETVEALAAGAREIDMVLNVGELRGGHHAEVLREIRAVVEAAHRGGGAIVKVILETALLTDEQKIAACGLAKDAGAEFVKTSTGFGPGGATVEDVALMRKAVGPAMGVKASGGIRTLADLQSMVAAGASRVGSSSSVKIIEAAG
jgi:deoxyribose-phosphate aldolase